MLSSWFVCLIDLLKILKEIIPPFQIVLGNANNYTIIKNVNKWRSYHISYTKPPVAILVYESMIRISFLLSPAASCLHPEHLTLNSLHMSTPRDENRVDTSPAFVDGKICGFLTKYTSIPKNIVFHDIITDTFIRIIFVLDALFSIFFIKSYLRCLEFLSV